MKKSRYRLLIRTVVILIPLVLLLGLLAYIKLRGFEKALEELVDSKSNGQYQLTIDDSSISITELSFKMNGISIRRNPSAPETGVREVDVPNLQLRFGSLISMFRVRQFDVDSLYISEPTVEIDARSKHDSIENKTKFSHQIIKLYPAVESLLSRFNIKSLSVKRATIGVEQKSTSSIRLGLVELLVEHWNIQKLTNKSQFQVKVAGQELIFGKVLLNFSEVEFNFQRHFLKFSDFNFASHDTLSQSSVEVGGKSLVLRALDYKELYERQRYTIKRALIDSAHIRARFNVKQKQETNLDEDAFTQIMKQAFGDCAIDTTVIRNTHIELALLQNNDSVKLNIPRGNFVFHSFNVSADSNRFQLGDIELNLNNISVSLPHRTSFRCDKILYDEHNDLLITNINVYDSARKRKVISGERVKVNNLDLLKLTLDKIVYARSVQVDNFDIQLTNEMMKRQGSSTKTKSQPFDLDSLSLNNVSVRYNDKNKNLMLNGFSAHLTHVTNDQLEGMEFKIHDVKARNASVRVKQVNGQIESEIANFSFDGSLLKSNKVVVKKDSFEVVINGLIASRSSNESILKDYLHWKVWQFNSLDLSGNLGQRTGNKNDSKNSMPKLQIDEIILESLMVRLKQNDQDVNFTGKQIRAASINLGGDQPMYGTIKGNFSDIQYNGQKLKATIQQAIVTYPEKIMITKLEIDRDSMMIQSDKVAISSISLVDTHWQFGAFQTQPVRIYEGDKIFMQSDSIKITNAQIVSGSTPVMKKVEIFNPLVDLSEREKNNADKKPGKTVAFTMPEQVIIHPGSVKLTHQNTLRFGEITSTGSGESIVCSDIRFETVKMHIQLHALQSSENKVVIDSVRILPNKEWLIANQTQQPRLNVSLAGIHMNNFSINSFLREGVAKNIDIVVHEFDLNVEQDKRMYPVPIEEKPHTLMGLLKLPDALSLRTLEVKHGRVAAVQISEVSGEPGMINLEDISATAKIDRQEGVTLNATTRLYNEGILDLNYQAIDSSTFKLGITLKDFDLTKMNQLLTPIKAVKFKSGYLHHYDLNVVADSESAVGEAIITYKDLHVEIFKFSEPDKKSLGSEIMTLLADGVILRHSKENAQAPVNQPRIKHKSIFNYWIKSASHGALNAIRKGKSENHSR